MMTEEIAAPKILEDLVHQAEQSSASDIHLQMNSSGAIVSLRLDGLMTPAKAYPLAIAERVFGRIKFLARLKTYEETMPQDGRIDQRALNSRSDIRVATYPTVTGEKIVLRLFQNTTARSLDELEFPAEGVEELRNYLRRPSGLMLLTGPAGSGKTTTIYACLQQLSASRERHIITIEDPVEQILPGVMQTEVNEARGLDFAKAARHLLRQDPQAFVIGEIRDEDTANIAVRAALTGHLVITTLHAGSCQGVLERMMTLCPDHSALAASIELVLNQRLMRKVCAACGGQGCEPCWKTGYQGRVPLVEWLKVSDPIRTQIRAHDLRATAPQRSLEISARALLQNGQTNEAEYRRIFGL